MPFAAVLGFPESSTEMSGARVVDSAEIRERYSSMLYKMKSLKLAVNERRNQMRTVQEAGGTKRRKSATVRPPKYITALQNLVEQDLQELKADYANGKAARVHAEKDVPQLDTLIKDLEYNFAEIIRSLYVSADPDTSDDEVSPAEQLVAEEPSVTPTVDERGSVVDVVDSFSQTASFLPEIKQTSLSSSSSSAKSIPSVNPGGVVASSDAQNPPSTTEPVTQDDLPEPLARSLTTLNKFPLRSQMPILNKRRDSYLRGTNVGYPLHSTFPRVSPVNRRALSLPSIDGTNSSTVTMKKSSFKRIDSAMAIRERAWRY